MTRELHSGGHRYEFPFQTDPLFSPTVRPPRNNFAEETPRICFFLSNTFSTNEPYLRNPKILGFILTFFPFISYQIVSSIR